MKSIDVLVYAFFVTYDHRQSVSAYGLGCKLMESVYLLNQSAAGVLHFKQGRYFPRLFFIYRKGDQTYAKQKNNKQNHQIHDGKSQTGFP